MEPNANALPSAGASWMDPRTEDIFNRIHQMGPVARELRAKQFVKIYGQMASIIPYDMLLWEKLFWFLKFLITHSMYWFVGYRILLGTVVMALLGTGVLAAS